MGDRTLAVGARLDGVVDGDRTLAVGVRRVEDVDGGGVGRVGDPGQSSIGGPANHPLEVRPIIHWRSTPLIGCPNHHPLGGPNHHPLGGPNHHPLGGPDHLSTPLPTSSILQPSHTPPPLHISDCWTDGAGCLYEGGSHTVQHCTALHCTALHSTAQHCTALHCTALYSPPPSSSSQSR